MEKSAFQEELNTLLPSISHETTINSKVNKYQSGLTNIMDKLAPLKRKKIKQDMKQPWYDEQVSREIQLKRLKERKWKSSGSEYDYNALQYQKRFVSKVIHAKRKNYYHDLFTNISRDTKKLYAESNKLLFRKEALPLPDEKDPKILAERFNQFFTSKIEKIMAGLIPTTTHPIDTSYIESIPLTDMTFSKFNTLECKEVEKLVKKSATKSCILDPIPTSLLKEHLNDFVPVLTDIINTSLQSGIFPDDLKNAALRPLLKGAKLKTEDKNYRPVSNLHYLGKLIERAACDQMVQFASRTGNIEKNQSAYRVGHSTESALLKVKSDLLHAMDKQEVSFLILLDLSAAFDTVDHDLLLNRLRFRYGFNDTILKWIASYLTSRTQQVLIGDNTFSDPSQIKCGVPQGSVLGPILFTLFTAPLGEVCRKHGINFQSYADDQQNYLSFKPSDANSLESCKESLEACISDIRKWMRTNKLKLNDDKTEVVLFGTRQQLEKLQNNELVNIKIGNEVIKPAPSARNLGYFMESELKSKVHVAKVCSTAYCTLKNIARVRNLLTPEATKVIVQGLVISKLDYCNILLLGVSSNQLNKLQMMQNMGCRVINNLQKFDHVSSAMRDLHWLKIPQRIQFKVLVTIYQCVNGLAPPFVADLLNLNLNKKGLRSDTQGKLPIQRCHLSQVRDSSIRYAGPRLWNKLPQHIRNAKTLTSFKTQLKTHLFSLCYDC